MTPVNDEARRIKGNIEKTGLLDPNHEAVHVMGTKSRKDEIDDAFFPWSSVVNPIEEGDLHKTRDNNPKGKGSGKYGKDVQAVRAKAKPRRLSSATDHYDLGEIAPRRLSGDKA